MRFLIGIDDTDDTQPPGTGRRARELGALLAEHGLGLPQGVTRHQLLVDEAIPYTSHNSSLCLAVESSASLEAVAAVSRSFLAQNSAAASDPGLCIAGPEALPPSVIDFGCSAQRTVLSKADALRLAAENGILLEELGGTGGGVIGALAAVGLRASGEDGRFVDLPGIRELQENALPAGEILDRCAVGAILDEEGRAIPADHLVYFDGWLRPSLRAGRPVVVVRRRGGEGRTPDSQEQTAEKGWVTVEHKHKSAEHSDATHSLFPGHRSLSGDRVGRPHRREQ